MSSAEDLITDIASIVTSVRPREIMTLKRIEEDYRAIYNKPIPFYDYGFSSLSELLESFPNHFQFSMADGLLVIRTNVRNAITDLIAKERKSKKPKNFVNNQSSNNATLFKKHKRREMKMDAELPSTMLKAFGEVAQQSNGGFYKGRLLMKFKEFTGYECRFQDYGFLDEFELIKYLQGKVFEVKGDVIHGLSNQGPSIFSLFQSLFSTKTGYTISCLQDHLSEMTNVSIPQLMKAQGHVNFVDVIYDAHAHGLLTYDQDLVYSPIDRVPSLGYTYPPGVCDINIVKVTSPADFTVEIIRNNGQPCRNTVHQRMQQLAANEPLLAMFRNNRTCAIEYDGEWYRARVGALFQSKSSPSVTIHFIDFPIELKTGIQVCLPTDRLRFVPAELDLIPAFLHNASLAYVSPEGGRLWSPQCCDSFTAMVTKPDCLYQSYLVRQTDDSSSVSLDLVAWTSKKEKVSIFHWLLQAGLAQPSFKNP